MQGLVDADDYTEFLTNIKLVSFGSLKIQSMFMSLPLRPFQR